MAQHRYAQVISYLSSPSATASDILKAGAALEGGAIAALQDQLCDVASVCPGMGKQKAAELAEARHIFALRTRGGLPDQALEKVQMAWDAVKKLVRQANALMEKFRPYRDADASKETYERMVQLLKKLKTVEMGLEGVAVLQLMPDGSDAQCEKAS